MVPCSKLAHIERSHKPYMPDLNNVMKRNALRTAEIWMDDYKYSVNLAWSLPLEVNTALYWGSPGANTNNTNTATNKM